jgi:hypothetical protein
VAYPLRFSSEAEKVGGLMQAKSLVMIVSIGLGALLAYVFVPMGRRRRRSDESLESGSERKSQVREEMIDKTLADSFPTSDPPSWNMGKEPT